MIIGIIEATNELWKQYNDLISVFVSGIALIYTWITSRKSENIKSTIQRLQLEVLVMEKNKRIMDWYSEVLFLTSKAINMLDETIMSRTQDIDYYKEKLEIEILMSNLASKSCLIFEDEEENFVYNKIVDKTYDFVDSFKEARYQYKEGSYYCNPGVKSNNDLIKITLCTIRCEILDLTETEIKRTKVNTVINQ